MAMTLKRMHCFKTDVDRIDIGDSDQEIQGETSSKHGMKGRLTDKGHGLGDSSDQSDHFIWKCV